MDLASFSPAIREVLSEDRLPVLGPGTPNERARGMLDRLKVDTLFAPQAVGDEDFARCCLAGLWLYHDFLDQAHNISQEIDTKSGSYWHGIMHRREPDYANAAYWFRRVRSHDIFPALRETAVQLTRVHAPDPAAAFLASQAAWDPFAFVDLCEHIEHGRSSAQLLARHVQAREWELLFEFCFRHAVRA
jgi:hypothetical protein